ncbi:threonine aldolase family protein [Scleromatobacter humisilvae]|uniref:Beta-eliminating lyase-related protein n=1 Tax=Scleromatobacter humisilvae TaxID=2897159 RepID=A0A9X2C1W5_9BURK|nr:beta-eliminating lyase-related protein [Scleromatobacter humisilvae]MCK9685430.1 beta-eliminating lyase-related protein [Scleromatobacter humisilvae]
MALTPEQRQALRKRCPLIVPGFDIPDAAGEFRQLADWCAANDVAHDTYGKGELVEGFERRIADLLGKPAATFMPSGVMAQLAAIRIWTESARLPRFGMHPTSHLAHHEEQAFAALMRLHGVPVGDRLRPMTAADLEAVAQPLACAIVELPIREAGGQLPSWDELEALKAAARARGVVLHMDGARLWESAAFYDKSYAEIAAGFASVYVSLYKGIGAFAGAMLAGDEAFVANARLWRSRMGGTLYHMSPMVAAAAMRFDERIALMPALYRRALSFASALRRHPRLRVNPEVPQANLLHLHFDAPADAVMQARDALAEDAAAWLFDNVRNVDVPGRSVTEIYVGDRLLAVDDARIDALFERLFVMLQPS